MERWLKILIGTGVSSVACIIFFLIYDRIVVYYRKKRHDVVGGGFTMKEVVRKSRQNEQERKEEMARLLFDEHVTQNHEVLCVCSESETRGCGLCIFLADREIEWYDENFPECCTKESDEKDFTFRNALAAVAHWANHFTLADAVNLLSKDGKLVKLVCSGTTRQWRSFFQYEKKYSFRLFMQWSENYVCGEVDRLELWESAVVAADRILKGEGENALRDLPLAGWKIRRVKPNMENFHMVPHPGEITPNDGQGSDDVGGVSGDESDYGRTLSFTTNERSSVGSNMSTTGPIGSVSSNVSAKGVNLPKGRKASSLANDLRRSLTEEKRNSLHHRFDDVALDDDHKGFDDDVFDEDGEVVSVSDKEQLLVQL
eukprot:TRINITY_DN4688_c0_g1_i1.p1 TRINITY_DN4688_c0_g1~~TRINITY_DN4688_c0_g1_i1.p1  ORF type:complete len:371 (-),score=74.82 TRINITY_DN4688_c0_g1_i1:251-1363(-)